MNGSAKAAPAVDGGRSTLRVWLLWPILALVITAGWKWPMLGYLVPICWGIAWGMAVSRGRSWCGNWCPRAHFLDLVFEKGTARRTLHRAWRGLPLRLVMMGILMGMLTWRASMAWGNWPKVGQVFVMIMTVTTVVGVIVALAGKARAWCAFCPGGTMAKWLARRKDPLTVSAACDECGTCERACPFSIAPHSYLAAGVVGDKDCMACSRCIEQCPQSALSYQLRARPALAGAAGGVDA